MEEHNEPYTIIKNRILEEYKINIYEQSILIALISFYNKEKGYAYPSYTQLKKRCKISNNKTLSRHMNTLINKGLILKKTVEGIGCKYIPNNELITRNIIPSSEVHHVQKCTTFRSEQRPSSEVNNDPVQKCTTTNTNKNTNKTTTTNSNSGFGIISFLDADLKKKINNSETFLKTKDKKILCNLIDNKGILDNELIKDCKNEINYLIDMGILVEEDNAFAINKEILSDILGTVQENDVAANNSGNQELYKLYEASGFGLINPISVSDIDDYVKEYSYQYVEEAFKEANRSGNRNLKYVGGILKNWKVNGMQKEKTKQSTLEQVLKELY